jgi:hypothetical protein
MSVYGDIHYLWLSQYDGLIVGMNAMSWEPPWTGFLPGSTIERVAKFSVIWILHDKELKQEAEFLLKESNE